MGNRGGRPAGTPISVPRGKDLNAARADNWNSPGHGRAMKQPATAQEVIERAAKVAERIGKKRGLPSKGARSGSIKHSIARQFINRFQRMFGSRKIEMEQSFIGRKGVNYGTRGSVRHDTLTSDPLNPGGFVSRDFKFGPSPKLSSTRETTLKNNAPRGGTRVEMITP